MDDWPIPVNSLGCAVASIGVLGAMYGVFVIYTSAHKWKGK